VAVVLTQFYKLRVMFTVASALLGTGGQEYGRLVILLLAIHDSSPQDFGSASLSADVLSNVVGRVYMRITPRSLQHYVLISSHLI
jgi:hypothetical protein